MASVMFNVSYYYRLASGPVHFKNVVPLSNVARSWDSHKDLRSAIAASSDFASRRLCETSKPMGIIWHVGDYVEQHGLTGLAWSTNRG